MSNVLIGIIGVILFIGLALAGALFLGPRFQESTNNSRGAAAVQAVTQISNAVNLYRLNEGKALMSHNATNDVIQRELVGNNYLKSIPANPTSDGVYVPMLSTSVGSRGATVESEYVIMQLSDNGGAVCSAIAKQSGQTLLANNAPPEVSTALPASSTGCVKIAAAGNIGNLLTAGGFYVFSRI
jgi:hypothetical protein